MKKMLMKVFALLTILVLVLSSFVALTEEAAEPTPAPVVEEQKVETPAPEPKAEEPKAEAPATEAPATETPATETPATEAPATEAPATEAPATEAPATEAPVTETPVTETPATEAPATEPTEVPSEAVTTEPTTEATTEPTTEATTEPTPVPFAADVKIRLLNQGDIFTGDEVTLKAVIENATAAYVISWEVNDGNGWKVIDGEEKDEYKFVATEENAGFEYRVVLTQA